MGVSQHLRLVIVRDVLWNDPATGVMRHAGAGDEQAITCAEDRALRLPGIL